MNINTQSSLLKKFEECKNLVNNESNKIKIDENIKIKLKIISQSISSKKDNLEICEEIPDEYKNLQSLNPETAMNLYVDTVLMYYSNTNSSGNIKEGSILIKGNTFK